MILFTFLWIPNVSISARVGQISMFNNPNSKWRRSVVAMATRMWKCMHACPCCSNGYTEEWSILAAGNGGCIKTKGSIHASSNVVSNFRVFRCTHYFRSSCLPRHKLNSGVRKARWLFSCTLFAWKQIAVFNLAAFCSNFIQHLNITLW